MKLRYLNLALLCILLFSFSTFAKESVKDEWISVRSKNFFLIGDAKEKDIIKVATKLEQFREVFNQLFPGTKFDSAIQTNVIVFKDSKSYKPFKPKNAKGEADKWIAGYFQSGEDVNYITLSTDGNLEDTYGTIFHEYVHYLLNTNFGETDVPPWFNEGLAEYYQTFSIKDDQIVTLGGLQDGHLYLLQKSQLIPLKDFFTVNNYSLHQNGNHSRSVFYAQAWALIHYLIQGNGGANSQALDNFLKLVINDVEPEKAFKQAFNTDYEAMEKELRKYAKQRTFKTSLATFKNKLIFDTEMSVVPLSEADANAYLGDLLYHTHELDDAAIYLQKSLDLNANQSLANTAFGLVKMRQGKFDEAKRYLEKAVTSDQNNHLIYYKYAYILSREDLDEFGYIARFPDAKAEMMRKSLLKAIEINPQFTQSYSLLAFINMVNGEKLDESAALLKKSLSIKPGDQDALLQLAQIYLRQENFIEAKNVAEKLIKSASEESVRKSSENLLNSITQMEEQKARIEKSRSEYENSRTEARNTENYEPTKLIQRDSLSKEELEKIEREEEIYNINRLLEAPKTGEAVILGYIQKIACINSEVIYTVKTKAGNIILQSKDFQSLTLMASTEVAEDKMVGCNAQLQDIHSVITYRKEINPKIKTQGTILAINFVPDFFEFRTAEEIVAKKPVVIVDEDIEQMRKDAMMQGIRDALRKPQAGELRGIGIAESIECGRKDITFNVRIGDKKLKLKADSPQDVLVGGFTREMEQVRLGCGAKFPPIKVVITYRPDDKKADEGKAVSLEFVPNSFEFK
ncbi:MAG: tetratricopeptide repeat protein [Acidobacteriota bacterium]|jgi:Tfp pilus assembly protein PilF|nr:tetratricopeptide repeat protein [Acidobacteriota bacterium]